MLEIIEAAVVEKAGVMFRLAACQLDLLESCRDKREVDDALKDLPETLDEMYLQMLSSIPKWQRESTIRLLQFLCHSERPLTLEEGVEAVSVNLNNGFHPGDRMPDPRELRTSCASLVALETRESNGSQVTEIQLARLSVKEYLTSDKVSDQFREHFSLANAKGSITRTCLVYLSSIRFYDSITLTEAENPLVQYAARYWLDHAGPAESLQDVQDAIWKLINNQYAYENWGRKPLLNKASTSTPKVDATATLSKLPLIKTIIKALLEKGADVNAQGGYYGNALQAASYKGNEAMVEALLEKGANVNAQCGEYGNALQATSYQGREAVIKMLAENDASMKVSTIYGLRQHEDSMKCHFSSPEQEDRERIQKRPRLSQSPTLDGALGEPATNRFRHNT